MITQERLKELLHYEPETGIFTWKIAASNRVSIGDVAGSTRGDGRIRINVDGESYLAHRLAWFYTHGIFPPNRIDHINQDPGNNRIKNLRPATAKQNSENRGAGTNNKSGFKGVSWFAPLSKWRAKICHHYKHIYLGCFDTPEEASAAYESAANKLFTHYKKAA